MDSYINLGLAYKAQFDNQRAISSLTNALKLQGNDPRVLTNLGIILYEEEKYDDAVVNFLRALDV